MKNHLIMIALLAFLPVVAQGQQEVSYLDSADRCAERDDWKGYQQWLNRGAKAGSKECMNRLGDYFFDKPDFKKAAKWYAKADDAHARYMLGGLYLNGLLGKGSVADVQRGWSLLRSSARDDYRDAIFLLGMLFGDRDRAECNFDSSVAYLRRLPDDAPALFALAQYYENGTGVERDSLMAMQLMRRAGELGLSDGYSYLGDYYRYGRGGVAADSMQAFQLYMQAAGIEDDNANGLADVADCYLNGIGTRVDTAKALYYLRDAVEAGSYAAAAELGDMYNYGRGGLEADGDSAWFYYRLASLGDNPRADYMIGSYLYNLGSYDNAMGYIVSAMMHGSTDAAVLYAQALLTGSGVDQDATMAVSLLEQLADADASGHAHWLLGLACYTGNGMPADNERAMRLLDSAASRGSARAMLTIGQLYNGSEGFDRDTVKVQYWFERAVAAGSVDAMLQLAGSYITGVAVPRNPQRAAELYQQAADRGSVEALCRLGYCYEQGEGVALNSRRAYNLYLQAAERGSAYGMRLLAYCYAQGIYVDQDMKQAVDWFTRAAEAGDVHSAFILGQLYAAGDGVKKNRKEAKRWLSIAAEAGIEEAADMLKTL